MLRMSIILRFIGAVSAMFIPLIGCSRAGNNQIEMILSSYPESFVLYIYQDGRVSSERELSASDNEYRNLRLWLKQNQEGWSEDANSYAPVWLFASDQIKFNVLKDAVVVNFTIDGKKWTQLSKPARDEDIEKLRSAGQVLK